MAGLTPLQKRLAELRRIASPQMPASIDRECHIAHALLALLPVVEAAYAFEHAVLARERLEEESELYGALDECERALTGTETKR